MCATIPVAAAIAGAAMSELGHENPLPFEDFAATDKRALYNYFRRSLGDEDSASDLVQDTLLEATRHYDRYNPERGPLRAWLFGIGQNRLRRRIRRQRLWERITPRIVEPEPPRTPEEMYELAERGDVLEGAIRALPDNQRQAVLLRYQEEMSCRDIAKLLMITPNAVSLNLHKARKSIKAFFKCRAEGGTHAM